MSLKERIQADIKEAMRAKQEVLRDTLRMVWGEVRKIEIDEKIFVDDAGLEKLIQKTIKQKDEAIALARQGGREDLVSKEEEEKEILVRYLPAQLSQGELETVVKTIINEMGAEGLKDLGRMMKEAQARIGTQADGKMISQTVKTLLS
jgi:uncharacterized protein YqeY